MEILVKDALCVWLVILLVCVVLVVSVDNMYSVRYPVNNLVKHRTVSVGIRLPRYVITSIAMIDNT